MVCSFFFLAHANYYFLILNCLAEKATNGQYQSNGKAKENSEVQKTPFSDYDFSAPSLAKFVPNNFGRYSIRCLDSLYLSGWNPVPFERRRRGANYYILKLKRMTTPYGEKSGEERKTQSPP